MGEEQRRFIVRARQRSRSALRAFDRNMMPEIDEVGIDGFKMSVAGTWRAGRSTHPDAITPDGFFELLCTVRSEVDWFRVPQRRSTSLIIMTRSNASSTLGHLKIEVKGRQGSQGAITVGLKGNPTRTLAHLLAEHGQADDFMLRIARLDPFTFFGLSSNPVDRCLGASTDNWLPDADQALQRLGPNPFGAFLPTFVTQLQSLVCSLLTPTFSGTVAGVDGCDVVIAEPGVEVRLRWGDVRVPQIESYIERHHSQAIAAVRTAATCALGDLDQVLIHRYPRLNSEWVERQEDCLSVAYPLNDRYRLVIYAKSPARIRFEVRRHGKGDYASAPPPTRPPDMLLSIMDIERQNLLTASPWANVGAMFDEHPVPMLGDLTRLCGLVAEACIVHEVNDVKAVLARLLEDGGLTVDERSDIPRSFVQSLRDLGVLRRMILRRRDHRRPGKRYTLAPEYRVLIEAVTLSFGTT